MDDHPDDQPSPEDAEYAALWLSELWATVPEYHPPAGAHDEPHADGHHATRWAA